MVGRISNKEYHEALRERVYEHLKEYGKPMRGEHLHTLTGMNIPYTFKRLSEKHPDIHSFKDGYYTYYVVGNSRELPINEERENIYNYLKEANGPIRAYELAKEMNMNISYAMPKLMETHKDLYKIKIGRKVYYYVAS